MKGIISMSEQEVDRVGVMQRLAAKEIKQRHAAGLLHISIRQVKRLLKAYKAHGAKGLIHKGRGKAGNRALPQKEKNRMLDIIKTNYADFGPTLACEKLAEVHCMHRADETVRKLMIDAGLWIAKERKIVRLHQLRERRDCLG
ncbi:transposase, partial [Candidatus Roizmanbacteria bacterium CG_4_9_14_0_8_um_filter_34_12]